MPGPSVRTWERECELSLARAQFRRAHAGPPAPWWWPGVRALLAGIVVVAICWVLTVGLWAALPSVAVAHGRHHHHHGHARRLGAVPRVAVPLSDEPQATPAAPGVVVSVLPSGEVVEEWDSTCQLPSEAEECAQVIRELEAEGVWS